MRSSGKLPKVSNITAQNVFNKTIDLDGKLLKGVREPREIGLLTLYEHYKVFEVQITCSII